jgi:hypothetical protein
VRESIDGLAIAHAQLPTDNTPPPYEKKEGTIFFVESGGRPNDKTPYGRFRVPRARTRALVRLVACAAHRRGSQKRIDDLAKKGLIKLDPDEPAEGQVGPQLQTVAKIHPSRLKLLCGILNKVHLHA